MKSCVEMIGLNINQQKQLENLISKKIQINPQELKPTHLIQHVMYVQNHSPIKGRYYHVPPKIKTPL